jgi:DNA adenine methylase
MQISNQLHAFNYLGSKYSVLPWLIPKMKRTRSWVDVFGGSATVTLNQSPYPIETYNDINEKLVNFFLQLRTHPQELTEALYLTPFSRKEYDNAWDTIGDTDLERARKFFVRIRQSFLATGSQKEMKGWAASIKKSRCNISEATSKYLNSVESLGLVVERMRRVQIECRPFDWIIRSYDSPNTMLFCDPPYDATHRSSSSNYEFEFSFEDHLHLHELAAGVQGFIAICGYNSAFMKELYKDFNYTEGPLRRNNRSPKKNVRECLWTNYDVYNCNTPHTLF